MSNEYQSDDDRMITRGEAREHRREVAGMLDEIRSGLAAIKNVMHIINCIEIRDGSITFRTKD